MDPSSENLKKQALTVTLVKITSFARTCFLHYFLDGEHYNAILKNPDVLSGNIITGTELKINLYTSDTDAFPEAELLLSDNDFIPEDFIAVHKKQLPAYSTFFGLISKPENGRGRYYMLRDHNADGLLLCTGTYEIKNGKGCCSVFDGQWPLRYNIIENYYYGIDRPESEIEYWKHPRIKLRKIDDNLIFKNLKKSYRDYAAGWHRYNFFFSDDWSLQFYRKQAILGFISITHTENGKNRLTPQLQREYAVLDWKNLVIDKGVGKIIGSGRIEKENISLHIDADPATALEQLRKAWPETWITDRYAELVIKLAAECIRKKDKRFRMWGVTLTAGSDKNIIAGELGYSIGKTYTSLSGFFHRGEKQYNNFGKLQMVMLADVLRKAGIKFWNLGQPYMEYKIKLGAEVVPRGLFLKRWDKAVRGRTPELGKYCRGKPAV